MNKQEFIHHYVLGKVVLRLAASPLPTDAEIEEWQQNARKIYEQMVRLDGENYI
jgi:hypothetical protein